MHFRSLKKKEMNILIKLLSSCVLQDAVVCTWSSCRSLRTPTWANRWRWAARSTWATRASTRSSGTRTTTSSAATCPASIRPVSCFPPEASSWTWVFTRWYLHAPPVGSTAAFFCWDEAQLFRRRVTPTSRRETLFVLRQTRLIFHYMRDSCRRHDEKTREKERAAFCPFSLLLAANQSGRRVLPPKATEWFLSVVKRGIRPALFEQSLLGGRGIPFWWFVNHKFKTFNRMLYKICNLEFKSALILNLNAQYKPEIICKIKSMANLSNSGAMSPVKL